ncbi:hypothetical protein Plhal304r1_c093g0172671 [Plasmopara halstedii]
MGNLSGNSGLLLAPPHFLSRRSLDRFLAYYIAFNPSEAQHNTFIISHRVPSQTRHFSQICRLALYRSSTLPISRVIGR